MADENLEDDLFADLYDVDDTAAISQVPTAQAAQVPQILVKQENAVVDDVSNEIQDVEQIKDEPKDGLVIQQNFSDEQGPNLDNGEEHGTGSNNYEEPAHHARYNNAGSKEDGKMFIGGLSWETSDESLKEYFSQYGEVAECTVMRDPTSGRSRGFGFLTFRDAKTVNSVMVKEHYLDGKIIDPKRAIPRDEQEKTSKIFVGGVSQEATEQDFREYFMQFGRVVDATLMIDKDTGRPRGFGFVTFDSETAVDLCLSQPLEIHGKPIEVKKAQPRGNMREDDDSSRGSNQRSGFKQGGFQKRGQDEMHNASGGGQGQGAMTNNMPNGMSPQLMAQYWQKMQQYFAMMQQSMAMGGAGRGAGMPMAMNPAMMQQMQQMQAMQAMQGGNVGAMNPAMLQQMQNMQTNMAGNGMGNGAIGMAGTSTSGAGSGTPGYTAYEQQMFEQQKYEQQSNQRQQQFQQGGNFNGNPGFGGGPSSWEGMYDDVPQPNATTSGRGGFHGHKNNSQRGSVPPTPAPMAPAAPAGAPTGPKNAGKPGANYRGGGRAGGSRGGFHPYARGGT